MISETWTYASANSVTYAGDLTGIYSPGMRVRLTQGTVKYFVIVSVVYSSSKYHDNLLRRRDL